LRAKPGLLSDAGGCMEKEKTKPNNKCCPVKQEPRFLSHERYDGYMAYNAGGLKRVDPGFRDWLWVDLFRDFTLRV
jgi:hypothetical protein